METIRIQKLFGEIAMQRRFISLAQLLNALNIQVMDKVEKNEHRLIGTILREQGTLNSSQINEVLAIKHLQWHSEQ